MIVLESIADRILVLNKGKVIYEGKAKKILKGSEKNTLIQVFKDDATAYNKKKHKILSYYHR